MPRPLPEGCVCSFDGEAIELWADKDGIPTLVKITGRESMLGFNQRETLEFYASPQVDTVFDKDGKSTRIQRQRSMPLSEEERAQLATIVKKLRTQFETLGAEVK